MNIREGLLNDAENRNFKFVRQPPKNRRDLQFRLNAAALKARSKGDGEILPVKMTGTYDHPECGLDK